MRRRAGALMASHGVVVVLRIAPLAKLRFPSTRARMKQIRQQLQAERGTV